MDSGTATLVGALLGGVLAILGGMLATLWLARRDDELEDKRRKARHATVVRIVTLELQSNCASLVGLGTVGKIANILS